MVARGVDVVQLPFPNGAYGADSKADRSKDHRTDLPITIQEPSLPRMGISFAASGPNVASSTCRMTFVCEEKVTIATGTPRAITAGTKRRKKGRTFCTSSDMSAPNLLRD